MIPSLLSFAAKGISMAPKAWGSATNKLVSIGKKYADPNHIAKYDLSKAKDSLKFGPNYGPAEFNRFKIKGLKRTTLGELPDQVKNPSGFKNMLKRKGGNLAHDAGNFLQNPAKFIRNDIRNTGYYTKTINGKKHLVRSSKLGRVGRLAVSPTGFAATTLATGSGGLKKRTKDSVGEYAAWRFTPGLAQTKMLYDITKSFG